MKKLPLLPFFNPLLKALTLFGVVSVFVLSSPLNAHLYKQNVCHGYQLTDAKVVIDPLEELVLKDGRKPGTPTHVHTTEDFLKLLSLYPDFCHHFMQCMAAAVDRTPILLNGFSMVFQDASNRPPETYATITIETKDPTVQERVTARHRNMFETHSDPILKTVEKKDNTTYIKTKNLAGLPVLIKKEHAQDSLTAPKDRGPQNKSTSKHTAFDNPFAVILSAPLFYVDSPFEQKRDLKQRILIDQAHETFHGFRHALGAIDLQEDVLLAPETRVLQETHSPRLDHSHAKDLKSTAHSAAFREIGGDIIVMPRGPYVSLYDFAKKASPQEQSNFWGFLLERIQELKRLKIPYKIQCVSGSSAGQKVPHFSVKLAVGV